MTSGNYSFQRIYNELNDIQKSDINLEESEIKEHNDSVEVTLIKNDGTRIETSIAILNGQLPSETEVINQLKGILGTEKTEKKQFSCTLESQNKNSLSKLLNIYKSQNVQTEEGIKQREVIKQAIHVYLLKLNSKEGIHLDPSGVHVLLDILESAQGDVKDKIHFILNHSILNISEDELLKMDISPKQAMMLIFSYDTLQDTTGKIGENLKILLKKTHENLAPDSPLKGQMESIWNMINLSGFESLKTFSQTILSPFDLNKLKNKDFDQLAYYKEYIDGFDEYKLEIHLLFFSVPGHYDQLNVNQMMALSEIATKKGLGSLFDQLISTTSPVVSTPEPLPQFKNVDDYIQTIIDTSYTENMTLIKRLLSEGELFSEAGDLSNSAWQSDSKDPQIYHLAKDFDFSALSIEKLVSFLISAYPDRLLNLSLSELISLKACLNRYNLTKLFKYLFNDWTIDSYIIRVQGSFELINQPENFHYDQLGNPEDFFIRLNAQSIHTIRKFWFSLDQSERDKIQLAIKGDSGDELRKFAWILHFINYQHKILFKDFYFKEIYLRFISELQPQEFSSFWNKLSPINQKDILNFSLENSSDSRVSKDKFIPLALKDPITFRDGLIIAFKNLTSKQISKIWSALDEPTKKKILTPLGHDELGNPTYESWQYILILNPKNDFNFSDNELISRFLNFLVETKVDKFFWNQLSNDQRNLIKSYNDIPLSQDSEGNWSFSDWQGQLATLILYAQIDDYTKFPNTFNFDELKDERDNFLRALTFVNRIEPQRFLDFWSRISDDQKQNIKKYIASNPLEEETQKILLNITGI